MNYDSLTPNYRHPTTRPTHHLRVGIATLQLDVLQMTVERLPRQSEFPHVTVAVMYLRINHP